MGTLIMGDVDAIKDYVFESSRLPQIRGGSALLMRCEEEVRRRIMEAGGTIWVARGGFFLAEVPQDQAPHLIREIHEIFARHTLTATITLVSEEAPPPSPPSPSPSLDGWAGRLARASPSLTPFSRRIAFLAARLRAAKEMKSHTPFFETFPFGRRCAICAKRAAMEWVSMPEGLTPACPVCIQRHTAGRQARRGIRRMWALWYDQATGQPFPDQPPQDLEQLVAGDPHGRLAFIYADGNDMGRHLMECTCPQDYRALSRRIFKGTYRAVFEALRDVLIAHHGSFWPFELINIGGDDITLLIQARYALPFAIHFLKNFERFLPSFTASCSVVVADHKYPIRYFEALAAGLLSQAKAQARRGGSAFQFLWLPDPIAVEEPELLLQRYEYLEKGARVQLTARPYTLSQVEELHQLARHLAELLPRSQRQRWAEALFQGVLPSVSFIRYQIARMPPGQQASLIEILNRTRALVASHPSNYLEFWVEDPSTNSRTWKTALLDVLEWAELLE